MIFGPEGYGYDTIGVGISFLGIVVGISLGLVTNIYQERYYQRQVIAAGHRDVPEARVHLGKIAAVILPLSLLAFAFLATPTIHPFFPVLASACWGWSFYTLSMISPSCLDHANLYSPHDPDIHRGCIQDILSIGVGWHRIDSQSCWRWLPAHWSFLVPPGRNKERKPRTYGDRCMSGTNTVHPGCQRNFVTAEKSLGRGTRGRER